MARRSPVIKPGLSDTPGIVLVDALSVVAAIYGYDLIHAYARAMSYVCGAALVLAVAWIIWVHGLPADFLSRNAIQHPGLLGTISTAALWQIAYAPYVSDYSRYMPHDTGSRARILGELLGLHARIAAADGARRYGRAWRGARAIWWRDLAR